MNSLSCLTRVKRNGKGRPKERSIPFITRPDIAFGIFNLVGTEIELENREKGNYDLDRLVNPNHVVVDTDNVRIHYPAPKFKLCRDDHSQHHRSHICDIGICDIGGIHSAPNINYDLICNGDPDCVVEYPGGPFNLRRVLEFAQLTGQRAWEAAIGDSDSLGTYSITSPDGLTLVGESDIWVRIQH